MGLSFHYRLQSPLQSDDEILGLVQRLRYKALELPFKNVGEIVELSGDNCDHSNVDSHHPLNWMLIQAVHYIFQPSFHELKPVRLIAFSVWPGEGCEEANFGLCRYPEMFISDSGIETAVDINGWYWQSFCKTQYASNPDVGGLKNFLRCHLSLVAMLDFANEIGLKVTVKDEGMFWEQRDIQQLATLVGESNAAMAAFAGALKDMMGSAVQSEIAKFPNFEHLEAEGRESD